MRTRTDVLRDAPLVAREGLPIDEAWMVIAKEDGPFGPRPLADALAQASVLIDIAFVTGFSISVDACIDGVGQHLADFGVGGCHPSHLLDIVALQRPAQALRAKP